jgi:DEAD/DEAH box helicase domain-containing protein
LCDRNDIGGISYTFHPQVEKAAVFVYDGYPGGVGLAQRGFEIILELLAKTLDLVRTCPCEQGCPACIYSPRCGSGNKPLDKEAARLILEALTGVISLADISLDKVQPHITSPSREEVSERVDQKRILYFDLETQKSATEVGGWQNMHLMMVSVAVVFDSLEDRFYIYKEDQTDGLFEHLFKADLVVGFNLKRFDYAVLSPYTHQNLRKIPTFDILEDIYNRLGFRLSLEHLVRETLNKGKSADGLQAIEWFKAGEIEKLTEYCKKDVMLTRDLFLEGVEKGYIVYRNKRQNERVRLLVDWHVSKITEGLRN